MNYYSSLLITGVPSSQINMWKVCHQTLQYIGKANSSVLISSFLVRISPYGPLPCIFFAFESWKIKNKHGPSQPYNKPLTNLASSSGTEDYYATEAVRGPITKINQSKCPIAGPIFSKYWTGHCPEWYRTCVFAVFAFFSRVINLLLTKLARDRTERISALGLFCMDLAMLGPYCQDLGLIFSQYGPRAWLIS